MSGAQSDSGIVVVDKPAGWTSHQVVSRLRRLYGTKKVGHAGTLDPMATGVLVVGVNRATRLLGVLTAADKGYQATIRLGQATVTDDAEGEVTSAPGADGITDAQIRTAAEAFVGDIEQVPSAVSAVKVDGQRSYARVRAGQDVTLKARPVRISRLDIGTITPATAADGTAVIDVEVAVDCTSGTYIRAIARDLGAALGTGGHLTALRRTQAGALGLADVRLGPDLDVATAPPLMSMGQAAQTALPTLTVDAATARAITYGKPVDMELASRTALLDESGLLLGLYVPCDGAAVAEAVFVQPGEVA